MTSISRSGPADDDHAANAVQRAFQALFTHATASVTEVAVGPQSEAGMARVDAGCLAGDVHPKRRAEYVAGRLSAGRALEQAGSAVHVVARDEEGLPLWPSGWLGSISHTARYAVAVAASDRRVDLLGVDAEVVRKWRAQSLRLVCSQRELSWLQGQPEAARDLYATVLFSAKEAYYKAQYPAFRQRLDFLDVDVELDAVDGRFAITPRRSVISAGELVGRCFLWSDLVGCGIEIASR